MKKILTLTAFLLVAFFSNPLKAQESEQKLYRIYISDFNRIKTIESKGITVCDLNPAGWIDVLARPDQIRNAGIEGAEVEFLGNSFKELYENHPNLKTSPPFHDYAGTNAELVSIATRYPAITKLDTIGFSVLGRAILCLKISDNPLSDEDEPPLLFIGAHHGNEVHSIEITLHQINYLTENYGVVPEVTQWVDNMEIWYVPLMNPDGREAMRRTNQNQVDLNRNYSFGFTAGGNHGPTPFSEPENRAIRDLAAQYPPIMSLSYHTSGEYLLYSWTHNDAGAPDSAAMIYHGSIISEAISYLVNGREQHYTLRQGGRWYFTEGEYCDYMYTAHNTLAYTVEMGVSQAPDYTVVPKMQEINLNGLKTMLRQVNKAGVTGLITNAVTGLPVPAIVDIPSIEKQGKVPQRTADRIFGRYYRYLEPGIYSFQISAPGYRTIVTDVTISADSLTNWDIKMEPAAMLELENLKISDGKWGQTTGNQDGFINPNETIGLSFELSNVQNIDANGAYAKISSTSPWIRVVADSLFFGMVAGFTTQVSADTACFRIDPGCPDGETPELAIYISDSEGFGWIERISFEIFAPTLKITGVTIDDSEGNSNGAFENGETVTVEISVANMGRMGIQDAAATLKTDDPWFSVTGAEDETEFLNAGTEHSFKFRAALSSNAPKASFAEFNLMILSWEGYTDTLTFNLNNIYGRFDDFESGENGWVHQSYGTTSNNHDDWQLGTPMGKGGDPDHAWSGESSWGTDMGWDSWQGTSWDGNYQSSVHNYLRSPAINCSDMKDVGLRFMRRLNTKVNDFARIRVNDLLVWESSRGGHADSDWKEITLNISDIADGNPAVAVVFELESNASNNAGGWNIDDFILADGLVAELSTAESEANPAGSALSDAWPNPFDLSTTIGYRNETPGPVELTILDLSGRKIRTLVSAVQSSGSHAVTWDGTNSGGQRVGPGIYLYQFKATRHAETKRLLFLQSR